MPVRQKLSFGQPVSVFMAPACFLRLTRTEQLFIERAEQRLSTIPVVFWMLLWWLKVRKCVFVHITHVYVYNKLSRRLLALSVESVVFKFEQSVCLQVYLYGVNVHFCLCIYNLNCVYVQVYLLLFKCMHVFEFPCSFLSLLSVLLCEWVKQAAGSCLFRDWPYTETGQDIKELAGGRLVVVAV